MDAVTRKWLLRWQIPDQLYEVAKDDLDRHIAESEEREREGAEYRQCLHTLVERLGGDPKTEALATVAAKHYWSPRKRELARRINFIIYHCEGPLMKAMLLDLAKEAKKP